MNAVNLYGLSDPLFVISGFLIARIVLHELASGGFSFCSFLERRLRRIAPALVLMLALSALAALMLLPADLRRFGSSLVAALTFLANIHFGRTTDYFAAGSQNAPLHLWSLSIEEQIYLAFPLCLLAVGPRLRQRRSWLLLLMLGAGLLQLLFTRRFAFSAYYLPFLRAAEFPLGAVLMLVTESASAIA